MASIIVSNSGKIITTAPAKMFCVSVQLDHDFFAQSLMH